MTTAYNQGRSVRLQPIQDSEAEEADTNPESEVKAKLPLSEKGEARVQNILNNLNRKSTDS
jgi:hypothetical protein